MQASKEDGVRCLSTKFSKFEAYADELLSSNPGSTVNVEICRDDLKEARRIFKRIFVCLNACKKDGRQIIGLV